MCIIKEKKRKHQAVSLELKLNIIAELQKGKSQRLVSDIFHVSRSTVNDIWRQREKIEQYITCCDNFTLVKKRCMIRQIHFPELDKACHIWFLQQRSKAAPVSGPILPEKSLQLFPKIYPQSDLGGFCPSSVGSKNFVIAFQLVILYRKNLGWMPKCFNFGFNSNSYLS